MRVNKYKEIIDVLNKIEGEIIISGHKNADYDSLCSTLALGLILEKIGKNVFVYIEPEKKEKIEYFKCDRLYCNDITSDKFVLITLDLNKFSRLPEKVEKNYKKASLIINIDHHNGNETNSNIVISDPNKSSTSEMIYDLLTIMKIEITKEISELLYVGMISDTNLLSNNANSKLFKIFSILLNKKIDSDFLVNKFYLEKTEYEMEIISYIIKNTIKEKLFHYAIIDMTKQPFSEVNYSDISKNCIPIVLYNKEINVFILIMDYGTKKKGEIRSKNNVDVSKLADLLTGGGHKHAAGFSNLKTIDEIINITNNFLDNVNE